MKPCRAVISRSSRAWDDREGLRPAHDEALYEVDSHPDGRIHRELIFYLFSDHSEIQASRQFDHGGDHGPIHRVRGEVVDERTIDLKVIHWQRTQRRE